MGLRKEGDRSHLQHVQVGPGVRLGVLHEPHRVVQDADDLRPTLSDVTISPPCITILHQISVLSPMYRPPRRNPADVLSGTQLTFRQFGVWMLQA